MPRARGGRRQGTPGTAYSNRTDLNQPVRTAPSDSYGERAAQERAQKAIPLPQRPTAPRPIPGEQPFGRPSDRPAEPLTAGMSMGAGPGPSAAMPAVDPVVEALRAAYRAFPSPALARLLEGVE